MRRKKKCSVSNNPQTEILTLAGERQAGGVSDSGHCHRADHRPQAGLLQRVPRYSFRPGWSHF